MRSKLHTTSVSADVLTNLYYGNDRGTTIEGFDTAIDYVNDSDSNTSISPVSDDTPMDTELSMHTIGGDPHNSWRMYVTLVVIR